MVRIVGIAGSIRKQGYSRQVLQYIQKAVQHKNSGVSFQIADISKLPLYDQDIEDHGSAPDEVAKFRDEVRSATALVFVTPEHNYCIPAALKNALDWGSRPYGKNSFEGKPGAVLSTSPGFLGGVKAQNRLKYILSTGLNVHLVNRPEVIVPLVHEKLDENGDIKDEFIKKNIDTLVEELLAWSNKINNESK